MLTLSIRVTLWASEDRGTWEDALGRYAAVVEAQGVESLPNLDRWYRDELPVAIRGRAVPFILHEELVGVTRWKMARGVWRARNLALVRGNDPEQVERVSREALGAIPDPRRPIRTLATLAGVGPATASAIAAAAAPDTYPFFDDRVARQVPDLGAVAFTPAYYDRYAEALRGRAARLGPDWTPAAVADALWAATGGKGAG